MKDIIIVEDGVKERERLEKLFIGAGYSVVACEGVNAAEEVLSENNFRLAILDIGLADKSGSHLFNTIKRSGKTPYIIIFTGNPSVHLKQRFLQEGAVDYIIKASPQAQNDSFLLRVREIIGIPQKGTPDGIELKVFMNKYLMPSSKQLFLDSDNSLPACRSCNQREYKVIFSHKTQMPPDILGQVICATCGKAMDPEIE
jgi:DNA-binding response OmpR family regulator